jgi:hypothetical protein
MAERLTQAQLITLRDNLFEAYSAISTSPTVSYTLGDRTFAYADRESLWNEICTLDRQIAMRSTTLKARGKNRIDWKAWN